MAVTRIVLDNLSLPRFVCGVVDVAALSEYIYKYIIINLSAGTPGRCASLCVPCCCHI